jgi:hypothetical protein
MADKAISELIAANQVTPTDLFVLEQSGTAKKLTGQILENWLVSFADGHGGIQSIEKTNTSGLVDTYRITLADTTTFDFMVTNGKSIRNITKTGTSGLVDTYTIAYNDGTIDTYTVTNGAKGDKGDNQYVWIKYASQKPTASSHSFGDVADNWIGIYSGASTTAPTDWAQYEWFQIKGEKGDTGAAATVISNVVEYQVSDSGTIIPSGAWGTSIPVVAQGRYLWTRTTTAFNTGSSAVSYSVSRMGIDGTGSVSSVASVSPDANGNVPLTAADIGAVPSAGGAMTGELNMNGQPISGLNAPTANDQAANMGFVNQQVKKAAPRNLLDNSDWRIKELIVNQRGKTSYADAGYTIDRWTVAASGMQVDLLESGLKIKSTTGTHNVFFQKMAVGTMKAGEIYTAAVQLADGSILLGSAIFPDVGGSIIAAGNGKGIWITLANYSTVQQFNINVNDATARTVVWAAIYEGEYTAETLPEYQPKGYGAELAECKRYYQRFLYAQFETIAFGYEGPAYSFIQLAGDDMRIAHPTLTLSAPISMGSAEHMPTECTVHNGTIIMGILYGAIENYVGTMYSYCSNPDGCIIELSADL